MSRGFPGKASDDRAKIAGLTALLSQAMTLDHFTPESLARSYGVTFEVAGRMLREAVLRRRLG